MATEHERAVKQAQKIHNNINRLMAKLGTSRNPNGKILVAYRQARRALRGNINNPQVMIETFGDIQDKTRQTIDDTFSQSVELGAEKAQKELSIYGLSGATSTVSHNAAAITIMGIVANQLGTIRALVTGGGANENLILGDDNRVGLLTPAPIIREAARWITTLIHSGYNDAIRKTGDEFLRQAIAGIDERTTDCCLRVHGQTTTIDGVFKLTGTPRYADELADPPFHWYCRTVTALVPREYAKDDLYKEMRRAANEELELMKETKGKPRPEVHPASGVTRR